MNPLIYAHRGASAYAPENTMSAFHEAARRYADGIELDVQMTKDGAIVVMHDEDVSRTTNSQGLVREKTLKEIKELDAGGWYSRLYVGEKVPTSGRSAHLFTGEFLAAEHRNQDLLGLV